jgi:hypothetical protein
VSCKLNNYLELKAKYAFYILVIMALSKYKSERTRKPEVPVLSKAEIPKYAASINKYANYIN